MGTDDDEIRLRLDGDEGEGGDRRPRHNDPLAQGHSVLDGEGARPLDEVVGLLLTQMGLGEARLRRRIGQTGPVPGRDRVEARDEQKGGVVEAGHLEGAIEDVLVLHEVADSSDNGCIHEYRSFRVCRGCWSVRRRRSRSW